MEVFSCYKRFIVCVMAIFSWLPVFLGQLNFLYITVPLSLFLKIIYWGEHEKFKQEKLLIFVGMFGQFIESISEMRMFSKVKENSILQFREKNFSIDYGNSWANLFRWQHSKRRLFCFFLIYTESAVGFVKLRTSLFKKSLNYNMQA